MHLSILALARRLWSIGNDTLVTCKQQNRSYHVPFYFNLNSFKKYKSYIKKKVNKTNAWILSDTKEQKQHFL